MTGGTYTSDAKVRSLTGFGTAEIGTADMAIMIKYASADIERYTGRVWTGRQVKEFLGYGDGTRNVWFVALKPVLSEVGGSITDDPRHVTIYVEGKEVPPEKYELLGAEGRITFADGEEPSAGAKVEATYYYDLDQIEEAATFLAAHYCYLPRSGGEEKAEIFYNRAMEILRQLGRKAFITKT